MSGSDLNEWFDDWRQRDTEDSAAQREERPNCRIEVKMRLNQENNETSVPDNLSKELLDTYNMDLTQPDLNTDIIIVSGTPVHHGFGEQQVLQIVQQYAPNTTILD